MKKIFLVLFILGISVDAYGATLTKTIGTDGRDYATIQAWEDDLDDGTNAANDPTAYEAGDDAVGECYDDSVFDEAVTIDGGGTVGLNSITLTVAEGERHDGTAGNGARCVTSSDKFFNFNGSCDGSLLWLEWNANGKRSPVQLDPASTNILTAQAIIVHGTEHHFALNGLYIRDIARALNCIVYDIKCTDSGTSTISGLYGRGYAEEDILNNTVHNAVNDNGSGWVKCIRIESDDPDHVIENNIATDPGGTTTGTKECYDLQNPTKATMDHNLSSDATATGTGSLTNVSSSTLFVSTVSGSEDLHLKLGADAINAGTDLITTPTGVNIDIDGRDRDAEDDTWDMGADEYVSAQVITVN